MGLFSSLFSKDKPIRSFEDFWHWFAKHEKEFHKAVRTQSNIERDFFKIISPKLAEVKDGFYYLTGMSDDKTVELVLTADGAIKNIPFVEELVNSAPQIDGWLFTALKPALNIRDVSINLNGYTFNESNLSFYANEHANFPDEIDITIVHAEFDEENKKTLTNGTYIFLDNFLGELNFATTIDNLVVTGKDKAEKELIPIEKLRDYLVWRQKEFVEKYEGVRHNTENDNYSLLKAGMKNGNELIATINTDLLEWDSKASHPYILHVEIPYNSKGNKGMPDEATYKLLGNIEEEIEGRLPDSKGYLNIGRQTAESLRENYFACKDFRNASKEMHEISVAYAPKVEIKYDIYKDKYWRSFDRFRTA